MRKNQDNALDGSIAEFTLGNPRCRVQRSSRAFEEGKRRKEQRAKGGSEEERASHDKALSRKYYYAKPDPLSRVWFPRLALSRVSGDTAVEARYILC